MVAPCTAGRRRDSRRRPPPARWPTLQVGHPRDCSSTLPHEAGRWHVSGRSDRISAKPTGSTRLRVAWGPRQGTDTPECRRSAASGMRRTIAPLPGWPSSSGPAQPADLGGEATIGTIKVSTGTVMVALQVVLARSVRLEAPSGGPVARPAHPREPVAETQPAWSRTLPVTGRRTRLFAGQENCTASSSVPGYRFLLRSRPPRRTRLDVAINRGRARQKPAVLKPRPQDG